MVNKAICLLLGLLGGLLGAAIHSMNTSVIKADVIELSGELVLVGKDGKATGLLRRLDGGGLLAFSSDLNAKSWKDEKAKLLIGTFPDGYSLIDFHDNGGTSRLALDVDNTGNSSISIGEMQQGKTGKKYLSISGNEEGVVIRATAKDAIASIGLYGLSNGASLTITDAAGQDQGVIEFTDKSAIQKFTEIRQCWNR